MRRIGAAVLIAVAAGGASAQYYPTPQPYRPTPTLTIGEQDDGQVYPAVVNGEIRAEFVQYPGPYLWQLGQDPHFEFLAVPTTEALPNSGYGGPKARKFRIRVTRPGRFPLVFQLRSYLNDRVERQVVVTIDGTPAYQPNRPAPQTYPPQPYPRQPYPQPNRPQPQPEPEWNDGPDSVEPFNERDAGRRIDVPVGEEQTIALPSNGSTGYYWAAWFQQNLFVLGDIREERPRNARIGQGGTSLVRFRIKSRGPAEVTLMYVPPGGGTAVKSYVFKFRGI